MRKFFNDLLKTKDPEKSGQSQFSQSRVYLLISFISLIGFLSGDMFWSVGGDNFEFIIDTLFYIMVFFGTYAMFKKGMSHTQQWKEFVESRKKG